MDINDLTSKSVNIEHSAIVLWLFAKNNEKEFISVYCLTVLFRGNGYCRCVNRCVGLQVVLDGFSDNGNAMMDLHDTSMCDCIST